MKPTERKRVFWVLRVFCPDMDGDLYIYDAKNWGQRREWWLTTTFENAYRFDYRSDARQASRAKCVKEKLKDGDGSWFWEVAEITETVATTYEAEVVCGDAPAMVQIARAVR